MDTLVRKPNGYASAAVPHCTANVFYGKSSITADQFDRTSIMGALQTL